MPEATPPKKLEIVSIQRPKKPQLETPPKKPTSPAGKPDATPPKAQLPKANKPKLKTPEEKAKEKARKEQPKLSRVEEALLADGTVLKIGDRIKVIAPWGLETEVEIFDFYMTENEIWAEYKTDNFPSEDWAFEKGCQRVATRN